MRGHRAGKQSYFPVGAGPCVPHNSHSFSLSSVQRHSKGSGVKETDSFDLNGAQGQIPRNDRL